jgi:serine/threonine protein kinase
MRRLSLRLQQYICRKMVDCVYRIHLVDLIGHCDIKPQNIVIDGFNLRLIDFGQAEPIDHLTNIMKGTDKYMAPEAIGN